MRLRNLLAAALASALVAGVTGATAQAAPVSSPAMAGRVVAWGDTDDVVAKAAMTVPGDLTAPVAAVATNTRSTAVVTADGQLRVWGQEGFAEVDWAPDDVTDATAVALGPQYGAVLHADGKITPWGSPDSPAFTDEVPEGLRAKAIAIGQGSLGYAVRTDGTLAVWGDEELREFYAVPESGLTDLVDVVANNFQVMALRADGTVVAWGAMPQYGQTSVPDFEGHKVTQITAGPTANGAVLDDGTIRVWGTVPPTGTPDFAGKKVISLSFNTVGFTPNAGAVTEDGMVHIWGAGAVAQLSDVPIDLDGEPVAAIAMGPKHAAVIVTAFRDVSKPAVTGTPRVGETLAAVPATFSLAPDTPATGQWYAGADAIAGQTGTTLVLDQAMLGKKISYRTTAGRAGETITSISNEVGPVTPRTIASTTTLSVAPATGEYGAARTATATVAKAGGTPTGTVSFKLGGTETTATLTGGTATWTLPATLPAGTQTMTATYHGDPTTDPSTSAAVAVTVERAASKLKAAKPKVKGKSKKVAQKVTITVTVTTADGVSPEGKVTFTLKGKTKKKVNAKVNAKGKVKVTIKKVKRGKYKAQVKYAGNANVAAAKTTTKFKV